MFEILFHITYNIVTMKKLKLLALAILSTLSLTGCDFFEYPRPLPPDTHEKVELDYDYSDYIANNTYDIDAAPNKGEAKLLVIPVWFKDSSTYITSTAKKAQLKSDIEKAYFGTNEETGWRSVKTFYEEESKGKLTITGVVTDWYECGYYSSSCSSDRTENIVSAAVKWYSNTSGDTTLSSFDCDNNGHLDGVMLIYAAPDYATSGNTNDNLWAYCFWLQKNDANVLKPTPNVFFWASYDFMYGRKNAISSFAGGDTTNCKLDAHTYIHEMGHVFGLEDYYDYSGQYNPAGGYSMQDYNVGGHDPYSVMSLGWANPYIPTSSTTYNLRPFTSSGDVILLANHTVNSPFDEYLLLELYTNDGLNAFDSKYQYCGNYPQGPSTPGIRIWHVDARLLYSKTSSYSFTKVTTNPLTSEGYVYHMMSNTYWSKDAEANCSPLGKDYADYDILHLIRNNKSVSNKITSNLTSYVLFKAGSSFSMDTHGKQFAKEGKLDSGKELGWTVNIKTVNSEGAEVEVIKL